jgi:hypothetical protein
MFFTDQNLHEQVMQRHRNVPLPLGGRVGARGAIISMKRGFLQSKKSDISLYRNNNPGTEVDRRRATDYTYSSWILIISVLFFASL